LQFNLAFTPIIGLSNWLDVSPDLHSLVFTYYRAFIFLFYLFFNMLTNKFYFRQF